MVVGVAVVDGRQETLEKAGRGDSGGFRGKARLSISRDEEEWPRARRWRIFGSS